MPSLSTAAAATASLATASFVTVRAAAGWSNHREMEILLAGSVPVVEFHPNFLELYRGLPVVQV